MVVIRVMTSLHVPARDKKRAPGLECITEVALGYHFSRGSLDVVSLFLVTQSKLCGITVQFGVLWS